VNSTAKDKPTGEQPIIFLPGVMGSKINCGPRELWPNLSLISRPDLPAMTLQADGVTNVAGSCSSSAAATGDVS
jgi:hypothetical protein